MQSEKCFHYGESENAFTDTRNVHFISGYVREPRNEKGKEDETRTLHTVEL